MGPITIKKTISISRDLGKINPNIETLNFEFEVNIVENSSSKKQLENLNKSIDNIFIYYNNALFTNKVSELYGTYKIVSTNVLPSISNMLDDIADSLGRTISKEYNKQGYVISTFIISNDKVILTYLV